MFPTDDMWHVATDLVKILKPVKTISEAIGAQSYPTLGLATFLVRQYHRKMSDLRAGFLTTTTGDKYLSTLLETLTVRFGIDAPNSSLEDVRHPMILVLPKCCR